MKLHCEPPLDELLRDRAVRLVMASDRVEEGDLRALLGRVREALRARHD